MAAPDLLDAFDRQARWCREPAPFTARVLERSRRWLEDDIDARRALQALDADPVAAAVPLRWVGALHHLALLGRPPWSLLWPPQTAPVADAAIDAAIRAAWREQQPVVRSTLALPPQTNEVQRSAALLPGLLHVAHRTGRPLVLLEIGASAGLNLWCDRYRHDHGRWAWGDPGAGLTLRCDWRGAVPSVEAGAHLRITRRMACDQHPVDLTREGEGLRLASFIWADQHERLLRLRRAQAVVAGWAAADGVVIEAMRAADFVTRELAAPTPGHATVLMQSVVWQYIAAGERAEIVDAVEAAGAAAGAETPLAWLRLEPPAADQHLELRCRLWPGGQDHLLARAHPHVTHLETEDFEPAPAPQAELLVLAGDIDASWAGYQHFAGWPVPVLVVAGNHEFDGRDVDEAGPALRAHVQGLGMTLLDRESLVVTSRSGRCVRFLGTARWCDFGVFGEAGRERAERAGSYFQRVMRAQRGGQPFDVAAVRAEADRCRRWLEVELALPARGQWQRTVVITHFAPSLRSADPRYGRQPGTAAFCNADDDLIPRADLWLHGHLHCRHDYGVPRPGAAPTRVVCQARGLASRGEDAGFDPLRVLVLD